MTMKNPLLSAEEIAAVGDSIERAQTLPPRVYTDPAVYDQESERLFRGGWLCAGRVDQIPNPGDYLTLDLLDEPLMVVRDKDDAVRVLSRVCKHRSSDLLPSSEPVERGNTATFKCPYHAWTYGLDGRLMGAPMMQDSEVLDKENCRLSEVRSEVWLGWVFVNLSGDAESVTEQLAPLARELAGYNIGDMVAVDVRDFASPWNWKVLVDNFMESYHHISTHKDSLQPILPAQSSYVAENDGPYSVLYMPSPEGGLQAVSSLPAIEGLPEQQSGALLAAVVFPFHLFALSPDALIWYQLLPSSYDSFHLRTYACFPSATVDDGSSAQAMRDQMEITASVHQEDIGACDAVWTGLKSRLAGSGALCAQEGSIQHFARWWIEEMTGPDE